MCGIAGIYGGGNIREMTRRLAHRGPDSEGFHEDGHVQLGVQRLAVLDREGGGQPMADETGRCWIAYNGELFNYLELRRELESRGRRFRTRSDTEVVLAAYLEWGAACLDRFLGMFALAIWDRSRLFLARDRLGEKPLYYAHPGRRFLFASEIKALLAEMPGEANVDERFPVLEAAIEPETLFKGIYSLPPGHSLTYDGGNVTISRYWALPDGPLDERNVATLAEELHDLFVDAVRIRLRADVPIGLFLSGGFDSLLIGAVARPATVFTCRLPYGDAYDEFEAASAAAAFLHADHVVVTLTPEEFQAELPRVVWHLDQPVATASTAAEFALARAASGRVKVVLGGQGADEAFGGYVRHVLLSEECRLAGAPLLRNYHPLARVLWGRGAFTDPADRYFELLNRGLGRSQPFRETARRLFGRYSGSLPNQMGAADFALTFPSLIQMNDRAAAAYGLENRTPFLDHRIIEFAFRLPAQAKIDGLTTKAILRHVGRKIVGAHVANQADKRGLAVPVGRWLTNELRPWADELAAGLARRGVEIQPRVDRGEFDRSLFTKVCLELWFRTFIDRNGAAPIA